MSSTDATEVPEVEEGAEPAAEPKPKIKFDLKVDSKSACERHFTVTIPREDIDRYFSEAFDELTPKASVPGFRAGRAPRKLVESRFKDQVKDQVKNSLLMDSLAQITEDDSFSPISEPDFDIDVIEIPETGPMTFEFNLEVRPEFDLPEWKGLEIERPVYEFSEEDVDRHLRRILREHGHLAPHDGPAAADDFLVANVTFKRPGEDGETVGRLEEQTIQVKPSVSFRNGVIKGFDKLMKGVSAGETRSATLKLTDNTARADLIGQEIEAQFDVLDVKRLELPDFDAEFLGRLGDFESEEALRETVKVSLEKQLNYHQMQQVRRQITNKLIASADWDLPPEMLKRQATREFERAVMELQSSGFDAPTIRAHANELRQNSVHRTAQALKEHFILEKLAEAEKIDALPEDYDAEIELMAAQQNTSARRLRARIEKRGLLDTLRNQIVERKAIETIFAQAQFKDTPFEPDAQAIEAVDYAIGGDEESAIPEAKHSEARELPEMEQHH